MPSEAGLNLKMNKHEKAIGGHLDGTYSASGMASAAKDAHSTLKAERNGRLAQKHHDKARDRARGHIQEHKQIIQDIAALVGQRHGFQRHSAAHSRSRKLNPPSMSQVRQVLGQDLERILGGTIFQSVGIGLTGSVGIGFVGGDVGYMRVFPLDLSDSKGLVSLDALGGTVAGIATEVRIELYTGKYKFLGGPGVSVNAGGGFAVEGVGVGASVSVDLDLLGLNFGGVGISLTAGWNPAESESPLEAEVDFSVGLGWSFYGKR